MKRVPNVIHRIFPDFFNFQRSKPVVLILSGALAFLFFWQGCKQNEDDPDDGWTEEEEQAYLAVELIQAQCSQVFTDYVATMDTNSAKEQLVEWFESDPSVAWAEISEQGVSVLYQNGMRGGIMIDPLRDTVGDVQMPDTNYLALLKNGLMSIPGKKDVMFFNPALSEFGRQFLYQRTVYFKELPKTKMNLKNVPLNNKASLGELEALASYGIIHYSGHGCAWPSAANISEVYAQTGEEISPEQSLKYWKEIKENKIILLTYAKKNKIYYWVGPEFITARNDFSKDTVLFYGDFCYSFLGGWPAIVNKFAKGVYVAVDWAVDANYSAAWGMHMIMNLCDTMKDVPVTVDEWLNNTPDLAKSYQNENNRTVSIRYAGDGTLTLWKPKIKLEIKSTETNGAPIAVPGNINKEYTFACNIEGGGDIMLMHLIWDFGDGSAPQEAFQNNQMNHSWTAAGTYLLKVEVRDIDTEQLLAETSANVSIDQQSNVYETSGPASNDNYSGNFKYTITTGSGYNFEVTRDESYINGNYIKKTLQIDFQQPTGSPVIFNIKCEALDLSSVFPGIVQITNTEMVQYWGAGVQSSFLGAYTTPYQIELSTSTSGYLALNAWLTTDQGGATGVMPIIYIDFVAQKK